MRLMRCDCSTCTAIVQLRLHRGVDRTHKVRDCLCFFDLPTITPILFTGHHAATCFMGWWTCLVSLAFCRQRSSIHMLTEPVGGGSPIESLSRRGTNMTSNAGAGWRSVSSQAVGKCLVRIVEIVSLGWRETLSCRSG